MIARIIVMVLVVIAAPRTTRAAEPPLSAERLAELRSGWDAAIRDATVALDKNPKDLNAFSRRGDAYFFAGKFKEAVADYDRLVELDPAVDASHWRRGIAYFYAGRYADAAAQFERYHSFDQVDRENGIWRYLSQVKAVGRDKAREGLLKYTKDDREPFPAVYELFAGRTTPEKILAQIESAKIANEEREKRLFYAELYIGLNEFIEDRLESTRRHLERAVKNTWGPNAGYGPNYMWHVGRLQEAALREKK